MTSKNLSSIFPEITNYEIFSDGRIFNIRKQEFKTPSKTKYGYLRVSIQQDNGNKRVFEMHRLVAQLFLTREPHQDRVDHIDGNKENNDISNLRWVTHAENMRGFISSKYGGIRDIANRNGTTSWEASWYEFNPETEQNKQRTKRFKTREEAVEHRQRMQAILNEKVAEREAKKGESKMTLPQAMKRIRDLEAEILSLKRRRNE